MATPKIIGCILMSLGFVVMLLSVVRAREPLKAIPYIGFSHGYCPDCFAHEMQKIAELPKG